MSPPRKWNVQVCTIWAPGCQASVAPTLFKPHSLVVGQWSNINVDGWRNGVLDRLAVQSDAPYLHVCKGGRGSNPDERGPSGGRDRPIGAPVVSSYVNSEWATATGLVAPDRIEGGHYLPRTVP